MNPTDFRAAAHSTTLWGDLLVQAALEDEHFKRYLRTRRRTWAERLFSLPWRPRQRSVVEQWPLGTEPGDRISFDLKAQL